MSEPRKLVWVPATQEQAWFLMGKTEAERHARRAAYKKLCDQMTPSCKPLNKPRGRK